MRLSAIVDRLFNTPTITVLDVRDLFKMTYPTAKSDIAKLERLGILRPVAEQRTATFYCDPIFTVTYADLNAPADDGAAPAVPDEPNG